MSETNENPSKPANSQGTPLFKSEVHTQIDGDFQRFEFEDVNEFLYSLAER